MLTVYGQQTDSIKFSIPETKILLMHHVNYPKLQKISDSCDVQELKFRKEISNTNKLLTECHSLLKTKDKTIQLTENQAKDKQEELEKSNKWRKVWRGTTLIIGVVALIETGVVYFIIN